MAHYQLLTCNVALSGDLGNVVARDQYQPITYPELIVLQHLHGEQSITDVFECGETEDVEPKREKERLMILYGAELVDRHIFPGHGIQVPEKNDRYKPRLVGTIVNPGPPGTPPLTPLETPQDVDPVAAQKPPPKAAGQIDHLKR